MEVGGHEVMEQEESLDLEEPDHELEHVHEKKEEDVADPDWYCELEKEEGDSSDDEDKEERTSMSTIK